MAQRQQQQEVMEATRETGMDPAVMASAASVLLSWYYFFVRKDRQRGLFVGLWAPTILSFASYFKQTKMSDRLERSAGGRSGGIAKSVQRIMEGR